MISSVEIFSAIFGVLGTLMLAVNGRFAGYGFVAYLVSNLGWIAFAISNQHYGLLIQQIIFSASSLLGIWVWLIKPRRSTAR